MNARANGEKQSFTQTMQGSPLVALELDIQRQPGLTRQITLEE